MDYIKRLVWQQRERITAAHEPAAEVTNVLYERSRDYFLDIIQRRYKHQGNIIILGGIQINVEPMDYFEPKVFFMLEPDGTQRDLLPEL